MMATLDPRDWKALCLAYELLPSTIRGKGTLTDEQAAALDDLHHDIEGLHQGILGVAKVFGATPPTMTL